MRFKDYKPGYLLPENSNIEFLELALKKLLQNNPHKDKNDIRYSHSKAKAEESQVKVLWGWR